MPWVPDLSHAHPPVYLAVADAIAEDIRTGRLRPGERLPTHRLLADLLGVNLSTVTRAYQEAARRRLVGGEVGRGTYVLGVYSEAAIFAIGQRPAGGLIDLSANRPPRLAQDADLAGWAPGPGDAARLLDYPGPEDLRRHREAVAHWLRRRGVEADPDAVQICAGAQHAMDTALGLWPESGEVACEALVYPGLKAAARHWRRRLHPMAMDREGVLPEAFEAACRSGVRLAVLSPTLHNPTTATMGLERRRRVLELARRWDVLLVEEDVYGLLPESGPPPLASLAPDQVVYLTGLSKTVAPGLRLGYLVLPRRLRERLREAEDHTTWYVSPLAMELATRWLGDGTAWRRLLAQRRELAARHRLCLRHLAGFLWRGEPHCPHLWLVPPAGGAAALARRALAAGLVVVPAEVFAAGRAGAEDGIRLSLGAATDRGALAEGLGRLATLLG